MKAIYLSGFLVFFTISALAQTNFLNRPVSPRLENSFLRNKNKQPMSSQFNRTEYGSKILSQDNMPCLVPDETLVAAMPTAKSILPGQYIPNPLFKYNTPAATGNMNLLLK